MLKLYSNPPDPHRPPSHTHTFQPSNLPNNHTPPISYVTRTISSLISPRVILPSVGRAPPLILHTLCVCACVLLHFFVLRFLISKSRIMCAAPPFTPRPPVPKYFVFTFHAPAERPLTGGFHDLLLFVRLSASAERRIVAARTIV